MIGIYFPDISNNPLAPKCRLQYFHLLSFKRKTYRIFDSFSVRSIFISPNEHEKQYFTSGEAMGENNTFGVCE